MAVYEGAYTSPWDELAIALVQVHTQEGDRNFAEAYREQAIVAKCVIDVVQHHAAGLM